MSRRLALIIATYEYDDTELGRLTTPLRDAEELADVLGDPAIGGFEVITLINEPRQTVGEAIGQFYADARPNDLTLLYFSGHGLKDDGGRLYLAMKDTRLSNKRWTAVTADHVNESLAESSSKQKIVILDCCYAGAFPAGTVTKADDTVHVIEKLSGTGRFVLTASDATQFAFEGDRLSGGDAPQSVFTRHLIEGLRDGAADSDLDGDITVDELYEYVFQKVTEERPQQRPKKHSSVSGKTVVAQNVNWSVPTDAQNSLDALLPDIRLQALTYLDVYFGRGNTAVRSRIRRTVEAVRDNDDSIAVRAAAGTWLTEHPIDDSVPRIQPSTERVRPKLVDKSELVLRKPAPRLVLRKEPAAVPIDRPDRRGDEPAPPKQPDAPPEKPAVERVASSRDRRYDAALGWLHSRAAVVTGVSVIVTSLAALTLYLVTAPSPPPSAGGSRTVGTPSGAGNSPSAAVSCGGKKTLRSSGSSTQADAMIRFVSAYQQVCPGYTINYTPNGSSAGVSEFIGNQTDIGGSDAPLDPSKGEPDAAATRCGSPAWNLPTVFSPIAVTYNVSGLTALNLDGPTAAKIFNGAITAWNDPAIKALNPMTSLPSSPIHVVFRSDPASTTDNFQQYLIGASDGAWGKPAGKNFNGGVGEAVNGTEGVSAAIKSTDGSISYSVWSVAKAQHLDIANIVPSAGADPVSITADSAGKTIAGATIKGQGNDLVIDTASFYKPTQLGSYPILMATYQIVCSTYPDAATGTAVKAFLQAAVGPGQNGLADDGYVPIPAAFQPKLSAAVSAIA